MNICEILETYKNIAVVGISHKEYRPSRDIVNFLVANDFNVAGINPAIKTAGDIPVYKSLKDVPFEIDIVNVFRRSEKIGEIVPDVLEVKPKVLWLQLGIRNDDAVQPVIDAGIQTIQDRCIKIEHKKCF
ncbi:MAG: CoA-binding protein [Melioribacteraceae bacterium]|nr:CoA-binding protein [Melioribacteraceae bacterium]MCF8352835.1 CoA-binding protein [Melioribacteraceae bacterium]MCF8393445.1 CoA-binding protein [Melioribacteraceae bacterium]MCF8417352.1 CoA-binding protein [Melioribacteraceae bacterium]